jgi:hypothetical protein
MPYRDFGPWRRDMQKLAASRKSRLASRAPARTEDDTTSRVALLLAAILTADIQLSQAAADVLPARPGNITYRQHIERWLRDGQ